MYLGYDIGYIGYNIVTLVDRAYQERISICESWGPFYR